ncbi:acyl-CoA dehydrogenase domain-containing protein, partial [mine drainage metagenome]
DPTNGKSMLLDSRITSKNGYTISIRDIEGSRFMYRAPLRELRFVLEELLGVGQLTACPALADYSDELGASILEEAGRFAEAVLEPLNRAGDREGARWSPEGVRAATGFKDAYRRYAEGGWPQLGADPRYGGQRVPQPVSSAMQEIIASANLAFKLCPTAHARGRCTRSRAAAPMRSGAYSCRGW